MTDPDLLVLLPYHVHLVPDHDRDRRDLRPDLRGVRRLSALALWLVALSRCRRFHPGRAGI
jgi:hypothetical protein